MLSKVRLDENGPNIFPWVGGKRKKSLAHNAELKLLHSPYKYSYTCFYMRLFGNTTAFQCLGRFANRFSFSMLFGQQKERSGSQFSSIKGKPIQLIHEQAPQCAAANTKHATNTEQNTSQNNVRFLLGPIFIPPILSSHLHLWCFVVRTWTRLQSFTSGLQSIWCFASLAFA